MVRIAGPAALAAAATLGLGACASTAPPRPIIPTMNTPVPETETMYAATAPDAPRRG